MTVRSRGNGYQADLMLNGTRYRPVFATEAAAVTWESEARLAAKLGKPIPQPTVDTLGNRGSALKTLDDFWKLAKKEKWAKGKDAVKSARNAELFLEWKGRNTPVKDIVSRDLYNFAMYCRDDLGNDYATVNRKMSAVKVVLKKALHEQVITQIPYIEKFKETSVGSIDFLDFGEEEPLLRLLEHRGWTRLAQFVVFLIDTGARINEGKRLNYDGITAKHVVLPDRKSGRTSFIPQTARVKATLAQCRVDSKDPERPFGDLNLDTCRRHLNEAYEKLGGKYGKITQPFHIFRHSCASRLAMRGIDAKRIMDWMDHSNLSVTQRYMKLSPSALDDVAAALEPATPKLRVVVND
ncbi:tyrosine-type recombinase/integrase [Sinorhizobium meliloti]|nr:tyrosine-type recombinase/integrase [Sinorhizobium meliloti]